MIAGFFAFAVGARCPGSTPGAQQNYKVGVPFVCGAFWKEEEKQTNEKTE